MGGGVCEPERLREVRFERNPATGSTTVTLSSSSRRKGQVAAVG